MLRALSIIRASSVLLLALTLGMAFRPAWAGDRDDDGIPNKEDRCPEEPEDRDGYRDGDGCRDPSTRVHLIVRDAEGRTVVGARSRLTGEGGRGSGAGDWRAEVHHGVYRLQIEADGYRSSDEQVVVPEQGDLMWSRRWSGWRVGCGSRCAMSPAGSFRVPR